MGKFQALLKFILVGILFFAITNYIGVACGQHTQQSNDYTNNSCQPTASSTKNFQPSREPAYCNQIFPAYPITITGTALYKIRQASALGFGAEQTTGNPISYAEVQVFDSNQNLVQCSQTGPNGELNFTVPQSLNTFTVKVNSRSDNAYVKVSVLDDPTNDQFYSLAGTFVPNVNKDIGTLTAGALVDSNNTILGAAFNIYTNILRANNSLRYFACGDAAPPGCADFSVAPKVITYWKKGFNPYAYVGGSSSVGLSFYAQGSGRLYILGGINGDVDSSDTDHFDDSIITHEYGHFIEDAFSHSDSPGGMHDGNSIIDPRLAWGEGWANFFSSAIRANKIYRDCYGTIDGPQGSNSTGCFLNYDVDRNLPQIDPSPGSPADPAGAGNFREFAITRALWDAVDPIRNIASGPTSGTNPDSNNAADSVAQPFANFWNVFKGDFASSNEHFRGMGKFLFIDNDSTLNNSGVFNADHILPNMQDYAQPLPTTSCNGSALSIFANDPASVTIGGETLCVRGNLNHYCSNQFASNDFYDVNFDGSNISTISISRTSGTAELDLYLYRSPYVFGNSCDMAAISSLGSEASKSISLSGLPAGHYLLNVNVYTGNGNPTSASSYKIYVNRNQVCP